MLAVAATVLGVAILLVLAIRGYGEHVQRQREEAYSQAQVALTERRLEDAVRELRGAGDYRDAAALLKDAEEHLARVASLYAAAEEKAQQQQWWDAADAFREVLELHPNYRDAESLLAQARVRMGRIAFTSNRDGNWEIYVMDADGSNVNRLTDHRAEDREPAWSPDGTRIAFASNRDGNWEIYVMGADGSSPTRLTNHRAQDRQPAWSPDATHIAFVSNRDAGNWHIYTMTIDGSNAVRFTQSKWGPTGTPPSSWFSVGGFYRPAWSRDALAFWDSHYAHTSSYPCVAVTRAQTFAPKCIVHLRLGTGDVGPITWSPDGALIAFQDQGQELMSKAIYVAGADGTHPNRLPVVRPTNQDWHPTWAPDGTRIGFVSNRHGNEEIYAMRTDGSGIVRLTNHPASDIEPSWGVPQSVAGPPRAANSAEVMVRLELGSLAEADRNTGYREVARTLQTRIASLTGEPPPVIGISFDRLRLYVAAQEVELVLAGVGYPVTITEVYEALAVDPPGRLCADGHRMHFRFETAVGSEAVRQAYRSGGSRATIVKTRGPREYIVYSPEFAPDQRDNSGVLVQVSTRKQVEDRLASVSPVTVLSFDGVACQQP